MRPPHNEPPPFPPPAEYKSMSLSTVSKADDHRLAATIRSRQPKRADDPWYTPFDRLERREHDPRPPPPFTANRTDLDQMLSKRFDGEDPQMAPAPLVAKRDRVVGSAYGHDVTHVAHKAPYCVFPAAPPAAAPAGAVPVPLEPWNKPNAREEWRRGLPERSLTRADDIEGTRALPLHRGPTRDHLDYSDVPLSTAGSRPARVRDPRSHPGPLYAADINGSRLRFAREPAPALPGAAPRRAVLERLRGPVDMTLDTRDVGAVPGDPHDRGVPRRSDRWTRNPNDVADVDGAQPRPRLPLQDLHAARLAATAERRAMLAEGRAAAEARCRLPGATLRSLERGFQVRDRDDCGLVSAPEARQVMVAHGVDGGATDAALRGFLDNAGNVRYRDMVPVLKAVAAPDPAPEAPAAPAAPGGEAPAAPGGEAPAAPAGEAPAAPAAPAAPVGEVLVPVAEGSGGGVPGPAALAPGYYEDGAAGMDARGRRWVPLREGPRGNGPRPDRRQLGNEPGGRWRLPIDATVYGPGRSGFAAAAAGARAGGGGPPALAAARRGVQDYASSGAGSGLLGAPRGARFSQVTGRELTMVPAHRVRPEGGVRERREREQLARDVATLSGL